MRNYSDYIKMFKALGETKRAMIIDMLSCGELCTCMILEEPEMSRSTLSHHMKFLCECGPVKSRGEGEWAYCSLNADAISKTKQFFCRIASDKENCICKENIDCCEGYDGNEQKISQSLLQSLGTESRVELSVMEKMKILEPTMCCPTGLYGVDVDPELLRISTMLDILKKRGVNVEHLNLSSAPRGFIVDQTINTYINTKGPEGLPAVVVGSKIVITGRYPTNEEFTKLFDLPEGMLTEQSEATEIKIIRKKPGGCDYKGGCC